MLIDFVKINTNFGNNITVFCGAEGVIAASFAPDIDEFMIRYDLEHEPGIDEKYIDQAARQLNEYFTGKRREFDLRLDFSLMKSDFQRSTLREVSRVPYGNTISYGELAKRVGSSARAVGRANALNPIPVVIPCHRVIGKDGRLVGYGGGLPLKEKLLRLEGAYFA